MASEEERFRWGRLDWLASAFLAALTLFVFWPLLTPFPSQRLYILAGDFTNQFYPYHYYAASEWWAGRIPLWNPYMFGGHPFQADIQTAVFYPLSLVVNLLAGRGGLPFRALEAQGVANYLLAITFSYLFLRTLVRDRLAAVLGAAIFALGGYLTSYPFQQLAMLETSIWLPLILFLIELSIRRPARMIVWSLAAGLAMAVAILAGHPQAALFTGYTAAAYLLFRSWSAGIGWRRVALSGVAFGLVVAGASAIQLIPTAELTVLSTRASMTYDIAASGYDYTALPGLLLPFWRGEKALYLGVVPLLLAAYALWRGPRRAVGFWGIIALAALALSFGDRGLLYRLFYAVAPGFAMFKGQERAAFIFDFAGAVLAAYGLAALRLRSSGIAPRRWLLAALALAGLGALGCAFWAQNDVLSGSLDLARIGYPSFLALLVASVVLLSVATRGAGPPRLKAAALVAVVGLGLGDLLAANWQNNMSPVDPALTASQQAAIDYLKVQEGREGEPLRVRPQRDDVLPSNYGAIARLAFATGDSPIVVQRTQDLFGSPEEWRLWQLLNVKYAVRSDPPNDALEAVFAQPSITVYRNRFSLPRAWVVEQVQHAGTSAESRDMVLAGSFNPGTTAIVETPLTTSLKPAQAGEKPLEQRITFDFYSPRRLYVHTQTSRDGFLVMSEAFYPGWQATLDGKPVPIHRTDHMLRGIELPAGDHELAMVYNPTSFWLGLAISIATMTIVVLTWLVPWARRQPALLHLRPARPSDRSTGTCPPPSPAQNQTVLP